MKVSIKYKKFGTLLYEEIGEVDSPKSFQKLAADAVHGFRKNHPEISLLDDGVVTLWDKV